MFSICGQEIFTAYRLESGLCLRIPTMSLVHSEIMSLAVPT